MAVTSKKKRKRSPQQWRAIKHKQQYPEEKKGLKCSGCELGSMRMKKSIRYSYMFYGCTNYPACTHAHAASKKGAPLPGKDGRPQPTKPRPKVPDPIDCSCGFNQRLKWSPKRQEWFFGCETWPKCWKCRSVFSTTNLWERLREDDFVLDSDAVVVPILCRAVID